MELRITPQIMAQRAIANARRHSDRLGSLQEQAATGRRLIRPSDDPAGMVLVLTNNAHIKRLEAYVANIVEARTQLEVGVTALREAADVMVRAREIAIEGANAANDSSAMRALAQEVDALIARMLDVSNSSHAGQFLFAGTATHTAPFTVTTTTSQGTPASVAYHGSSDRLEENVGPSQTVATVYPGSEMFQSRRRGATVFSGTTGAASGSGTDSATGQGTLTVTHTLTSYAAGSGVTPGSSSASGDNILGPAGAHRLTINDTSGTGAAGVVSLNGGALFPFTNADTNLQVTGPLGEIVYLNTTAITPGFNGSVDITANGTLSVDNGASFVPIDFSGNQIVTHSQNGHVTNVNSSNIRRAGTSTVDYTGTYDAFQILIALRDDLRNTQNLSPSAQLDSISNRIDELDRIRGAILDAVGEQSVGLENLESLENRLSNIQLETRKLNSEVESADLTEVLVNLQAQQNLLQLTFAAAATVLDQSLLDFLR